MSFDFSWENRAGKFKVSFKRDALMLVAGAFVTAGAGALTAPWWFPLLALALGFSGISIGPAANWIIGIPLIIIGVGCLIVKVFVVDRLTRAIAADRALITSRPPDPSALAAHFRNLTTDDSYWSSGDTLFQAEYTLYADAAHRLQDRKTRALFTEFNGSSQRLHLFIANNFAWFPPQQVNYRDHRYCLRPEWNIDRGLVCPDPAKERDYIRLRAELDELVRASEIAHTALIERMRQLGHL